VSEEPVERAAPVRIPAADGQGTAEEPVRTRRHGAGGRPLVEDLRPDLPETPARAVRARPPVIVRRDLLPGLSLMSFVALSGLAVGWLWSALAPSQRVLISDGTRVPLLDESSHRFDDLVIFMLLGLGVGAVVGAAVWLLRERRGPVIMFAAVAGSALAAWLAAQVGISLAGGHYAVAGVQANGTVVDVAPVLESSWAILAQPLTTALAYGAMAAWNGMDDLGRRLG